mmetsp:Transcript_2304/g.3221  ORF Transcript_2304/g.3221 Transcript_2304/m.3221 type:complete len:115 (+) Transcript_2304:290-634(+)
MADAINRSVLLSTPSPRRHKDKDKDNDSLTPPLPLAPKKGRTMRYRSPTRNKDKEKDNDSLTPPAAPKKGRTSRSRTSRHQYQTPPQTQKKSAELCYQSPLLPPCLWRSAFPAS